MTNSQKGVMKHKYFLKVADVYIWKVFKVLGLNCNHCWEVHFTSKEVGSTYSQNNGTTAKCLIHKLFLHKTFARTLEREKMDGIVDRRNVNIE